MSLSHYYLHVSTRFISSWNPETITPKAAIIQETFSKYVTVASEFLSPHEWYKPDGEIRPFERIAIFKKHILKFIKPWVNGIFSCHLLTVIKIIAQPQLDLSHVYEHKVHFVKYSNFIRFPCVEILWKGTTSARYTYALPMIKALSYLNYLVQSKIKYLLTNFILFYLFMFFFFRILLLEYFAVLVSTRFVGNMCNWWGFSVLSWKQKSSAEITFTKPFGNYSFLIMSMPTITKSPKMKDKDVAAAH